MRSSRQGVPSGLMSDRTLGCLLGAILGMLLTCLLALGVLALTGDDTPVSGPPPPSVYDIEAIVQEDYINRTFLESTASLPQPVPLTAGHLDVRPGANADFAVQSQLGPLQPVFRGSVSFRATESGDLRITLTEVRVGHLPVTMFVPSGLLEEINQDVNRQLNERTGATDVRLIGVTSDENTLRFYLISAQ